MSILSLHPDQVQILTGIQSAVRILGLKEHLTIVGSLGRFLAGATSTVGDIDVQIEGKLCERYWDFLEILSRHSLTSIFDVFERPRFPWNFCRPQVEHALALTVDCNANVRGLKYANLDILIKECDLSCVRNPSSSQWVQREPGDMRNWNNEANRNNLIREGHERLRAAIKEGQTKWESQSRNIEEDPQLNLKFAW